MKTRVFVNIPTVFFSYHRLIKYVFYLNCTISYQKSIPYLFMFILINIRKANISYFLFSLILKYLKTKHLFFLIHSQNESLTAFAPFLAYSSVGTYPGEWIK